MRALGAALVLGLFAGSGWAGDPKRGKRQFQRCFACHSVDPAETARLQGPSLAGIVGRKAGAIAGFEYSPALLARAAAGLTWTPEALDALMTDPENFIPGTRMGFPGLADATDRADIIAYLREGNRE